MMKAIILAAGQGARLKKYTKNLPKGMLSFMGKTIIERQIELYRACGIESISIVTGFAADKIDYKGVKYFHNERYMETNMVESLLTAREAFEEDAIVSYSDILFDKAMLKRMMDTEGDFNCAVDDNWQSYWKKRYGRVDFDTESLTIDEKDNITELGLENPPLEQINARYIGLLKFSRGGLETIEDIMDKAHTEYGEKPWQQSGKPVLQAYMTDLLNAIIASGREVKAIRFKNGWLEFDTNEDYEKAMAWGKDGSLSELISL